MLGGPNNVNAKELGRCYGECDKDSHCAYGLKCFQRDKFEKIPGCAGVGKSGWDYCYDPLIAELLVPTTTTKKPTTTTKKPTTTPAKTTKKKKELDSDNSRKEAGELHRVSMCSRCNNIEKDVLSSR